MVNSYELADKHGMLSHDEIDLLQFCAKISGKHDPNRSVVDLLPNPITVVNIGANIGTSSCAILEANPNAFVFSIDVKPWPEERQHIVECGLNPKRIVRLLGSSSEIGVHFPYKADLVFVDGAHDDKGVTGDIEAWKPKCKSIVLFHDYHHPNYAKKPGVNLDNIVDTAMADWERIGEARYLVAFRRKE